MLFLPKYFEGFLLPTSYPGSSAKDKKRIMERLRQDHATHLGTWEFFEVQQKDIQF